jgi:hypothetical protein
LKKRLLEKANQIKRKCRCFCCRSLTTIVLSTAIVAVILSLHSNRHRHVVDRTKFAVSIDYYYFFVVSVGDKDTKAKVIALPAIRDLFVLHSIDVPLCASTHFDNSQNRSKPKRVCVCKKQNKPTNTNTKSQTKQTSLDRDHRRWQRQAMTARASTSRRVAPIDCRQRKCSTICADTTALDDAGVASQ